MLRDTEHEFVGSSGNGEGANISSQPMTATPLSKLSGASREQKANDPAKSNLLTPSAHLSGDEPGPEAKSSSKPKRHAPPVKPSAPADAGGQYGTENHLQCAASETIPGHAGGEEGHLISETHISLADLAPIPATGGTGGGRLVLVTLERNASPELIHAIIEQWKRRQNWHRAEKSLTLQAKALCRRLCGGDKGEAEKIFKSVMKDGDHPLTDIAFGATAPLIEARRVLEGHRKHVEKELTRMAKELPVWEWVETVRGVGPLSLAGIVGEAGDVGTYKSVSALWKRMGLAVIGGERQRRITGPAAIEHGYNAERRSLMWNVGGCIIKSGGELRAVYDERKAYEANRVETKAHAHNRAKRYMEKRFLRQLYAAWRGGQASCEAQRHVASPNSLEADQ